VYWSADFAREPTLSPTWVAKYLAAGGVAGLISRTITAPIDRLKVLYQVRSKIAQSGTQQSGILRGLQSIYHEGGVRAFWRGNLTNIMKVVPESALFFTLFESFKAQICKDYAHPRLSEVVAASSGSSLVTALTVYPLETIKARWMTAPSGQYRSLPECVASLLKSNGWRGLYQGLGIQLLGIVPYGAVNLTLYHTAKTEYTNKFKRRPDFFATAAIGATSSAVGQLIAYPSALVRTHLQTQGTEGNPTTYSGMVGCIRHIWMKDKFYGFYRGLLANYMKTIPALGITFAVYEAAVSKFGL